jgi:heme oxygenase
MTWPPPVEQRRRQTWSCRLALLGAGTGTGGRGNMTERASTELTIGLGTAALRAATSVAHRRLEVDLDLMSPALTMARYGSLLAAFASVHATLDDEIWGQICAAGPVDTLAELDFASRRKLPTLLIDLAVLDLPEPRRVPLPIRSLNAALGALYVCEGATLGGRIIAPHVLQVLGPNTPVAFFTSYGTDVPRMWSTCRRVFDELLATPFAARQAANAATDVFDRIAYALLS